jgi:beta-alanine degradation protein BauB
MYRLIAAVIAAASVLSAGGGAMAADQTPAQAVEKVLLENEKVRVLDIRFEPGAVSKMQDRSPRVVYYFTDAHFTITTPDGKTTQRDTKAGSAAWRAQDTTEVTNTGKEDVRLVVTYLK